MSAQQPIASVRSRPTLVAASKVAIANTSGQDTAPVTTRSVGPGELVEIVYDSADGESVLWDVIEPWGLDFKSYSVCVADCPPKAVFVCSSGVAAGRIRVTCYVVRIADGKAVQRLIKHEITVTGPAPIDPIKPDPKPDPVKPVLTPIEQFVSTKAASLVTSQPQQFAAEAPKVAAVYRDVAGKCESLGSAQAVLLATRDGNRAAIGLEAAKRWAPFGDGLGEQLNMLVAAGKLSTLADHARVWKEIASGLDLAAKGVAP